MPRTASAALIAHMSSPSATVAYLQKTGPFPSGAYVRINSTAKDIRYDCGDGLGPQWYYARTGLQLANISGANDLSAENSEANTLAEIPTYPGQGITVEMVDNGDLDDVEFLIFAINYMDHSMGHCICAGGPIGRVRATPDGNLITIELRSWCDLLRQNSVVENWSLTCRVKRFGSQPGEERYPCKFDAEALLVSGVTVTAPGTEAFRDFTASSLGQATGYFNWGEVRWQSGANAGRTSEIGTFTSGGAISLRFITRKLIANGDTFDILPGCSREWGRASIDDPIANNSCLHWGNELNFRGEPFQPVADAIGLTVPGAADGGY